MLAALLALALVIPPAPAGRVNDYAGLLAAGDRARLETLLAERERATGAQMVIAIFPSLEGENLEDYSIRLAQQWRIGEKGLDNGVILLVFVRDRKLRLEVGYGLESVIPDAVAGQVIREVITPRFRERRYAGGLEAAVEAVFSRIAPAPGGAKPAAPATPPRRPRPEPLPAWAPVFIVLGFLGIAGLVLLLFVRTVRRARRLFYTASRHGWSRRSFGGSSSWRGGSSGSSGGSSSDGGGFSGGGGSFGGGGASGGW